jgi:nucleoside-diphosphate-sugar epimerase
LATELVSIAGEHNQCASLILLHSDSCEAQPDLTFPSMTMSAAAASLPVGYRSTHGASVLVTGSSGFVGARLVEMLLERKAKRVVCFDVVPPNPTLKDRFECSKTKSNPSASLEIITDSLTNKQAVIEACKDVDIVYHIAALVGPFHDRDKYEAVNFGGTLNILEGCKVHKVPRLVFSSSPSTRFTGADVTGQREEELPIPQIFLALYAETKAKAEIAVTAALDPPNLYTINVAPHQVYGPHDQLFLPNLLEAAGNNMLRIFGPGRNLISVCYVDNYCHGLMCGGDSMRDNSPTLGKFYIITDGEPQLFWDILNQAVVAMGFTDLYTKFHLPTWLLYGLAYICNFVGFVIGKKLKLNPFNVRMLTMHRYFSLENARRDLHYEPLFKFDESWAKTIDWFKVNWLPGYLTKTKGQ